MNIIFLDVDGVLNSMPYMESLKYEKGVHDEINDFNLQMLSKIYHLCNCKIVLSSTWRDLDDKENEECYKMYKYLVDSLAKYDMEIIDKTPIIDMNRPLEIKTWLENNKDKNIEHFVSLDDDFSRKYYHIHGIEKCLVHTSFFCKKLKDGGLQQEHVDKAIRKLTAK